MEADQPKPKHAGGRPTDYRVEYCDQVEEAMGIGFSLTAFAGMIGVNKSTICRWKEAYPEFCDAVTRATAKRMLHWETLGLKAADKGGGPGASTMIIFGLKNMDRASSDGESEWADIQKIDQTFKGEVGITEIRRTLVDSRHTVPGGIPANPGKPS